MRTIAGAVERFYRFGFMRMKLLLPLQGTFDNKLEDGRALVETESLCCCSPVIVFLFDTKEIIGK